jgi:splicing factor 1
MESESGAKIAIRGKGSVKEGKGRSDAAHSSNQEEDLHCLIMADTEEKVNKAKKLIHNIIETVGPSPRAPCLLLSEANQMCYRLRRFLKGRTS